MKRMTFALLLGLSAMVAMAQTQEKKHVPLVDIELAYIDSTNIMDKATFAAFEPIYRSYATERRGLRREIRASKKKLRSDTLPDAQAKAELDRMLNNQVRLAELPRDYAARFLTLLTPQQLAKVYRVNDVLRKQLIRARRSQPEAGQKK